MMNKIIVFGAGNNAKKIVRYIDKKKNAILYYADNDPAKQGSGWGGVKIISPLLITEVEYDYVLIASLYWKEIRAQLRQLGVSAEKIRCPMSPMKIGRFQKEYRDIFNVFGKIQFYYRKWHLTEQFHPDVMGIFVNPYFFSRKNLYKSVKEYSPYMTGKCMDFGCGIQPYRRMLPAREYVGVEIESDSKMPGVIYYDGHTLPFEDETFDSIISSEVFEHISNVEEIITELRRVLKTGGIMLLTVPFVYPKHCWPYDFKRYTMQGLQNMLIDERFECIECKADSNYQECMAQLKNVYWQEDIKAKTSLGKLAKNLMITINNLNGIIAGRLMPHSDKLYLDNVMVVKKI